ncbi:MAG: type II secretion system protein [Deltaproteobacteria bacterium]|nr:type II secretion system protein [Deltaproteobacteria bacterium]
MSRGFSLIELVVVMALIGLFLFFTVPRFQQILIPNDARKVARWFIAHAAAARSHAMAEQTRITIHVGITEGRLWVTRETMSEADALAAMKKGMVLDSRVRIRKVEFVTRDPVTSGVARILFYPDGHADPVWIHLTDNAKRRTRLFVEPFLPHIRYLDTKDEYALSRTPGIFLNVAKVGRLQSRGAKGEAVVVYGEPFATQDLQSSGFPEG